MSLVRKLENGKEGQRKAGGSEFRRDGPAFRKAWKLQDFHEKY